MARRRYPIEPPPIYPFPRPFPRPLPFPHPLPPSQPPYLVSLETLTDEQILKISSGGLKRWERTGLYGTFDTHSR